ncbi:MAG TPA: PilZ domain-containing protein [Candidatus Acidoferrales bacterium]|nr:PilZ domain-containing protein [Candidatus Acidoferrales bacterium]
MALKMIPNFFQSGDPETPRRGPRITPDPLLTIRLPEGNQGIVLDLSEEGLGFLAASPIDEGRSIRFVLADRSNRRSEATGQLMWKDAAGKRGGLRFTHVSGELRELIQSYLGQEDSGAAGADEPLPPGFDIPDSFPSQIHAGIGIPDVEKKRPRKWNFVANATTVVAATLVAATIWYNIDGQRKVPSLDTVKSYVVKYVFTKINRVPFGWAAKLDLHPALKEKTMAAGTNAAPVTNVTPAMDAKSEPPSTVPAAPPDASLSAQPTSDSTQVTAYSTTATAPTPQIVTPAVEAAAPVAQHPRAAEIPVKADNYPAKALVKNEEAAKSQEAAPVTTQAAAVEEPDEQVAAARKLLTKQDDPTNQTKGVRMLWQAVAKGNPAAEVELAGLYLSGTGVSKSCSQAVVLLKAAQSRKSATAQQKLAELPQFGCPSENDSPASLKPAVDSDR